MLARNLLKKPVGPSEVVGLTARLLEKHSKGYSKVKFSTTTNKDWTHPVVRKKLGLYLKKHFFENKLSTKADFEKFVMGAESILFAGSKQVEIDAELRKLLIGFAGRARFLGVQACVRESD